MVGSKTAAQFQTVIIRGGNVNTHTQNLAEKAISK